MTPAVLRRGAWALIAALSLALLFYFHAAHLERAFFTHDTDFDVLGLRALIGHGFCAAWVPLTRAYAGAEAALVPFGPNFAVPGGGGLLLTRPLVYLLIVAVPYALFGWVALYAVPLVSGLGAAIIGGRLARPASGVGETISGPLVWLASPLVFYSLCAWNMALGAFIAAAAASMCVTSSRRRWWLAAGLILGLGLGVREELVAVALGLAAAGAFTRRPALFLGAGLALGGAAVAALHLWAYGQPLPLHFSQNTTAPSEWLATRVAVANALLFAAPASWWVWASAAAGAAMAWLGTASSPHRRRAAFLGGLAAAAFAAMASVLTQTDLYEATLSAGSVLAAAPFLALALIDAPHASARRRWLRLAGLVAAAFIVLSAPPGAAIAAHWGPRMLLVTVPLLGAVALDADVFATLERAEKWMVAAILATSLGDQAIGLTVLIEKKQQTRAYHAQLAASAPAAVFSDNWVAIADLASDYPDRPLFWVRSPGDVKRAVGALRASGQARLIVITRPEGPLAQLLAEGVAAGRLRLEREAPIDARLFTLRGARLFDYVLM